MKYLNKAYKTLLLACTFGFLIGSTVMMVITFLTAYTSPDYAVIVTVNSYGEAHIELFLLTTLICTSIITFYLYHTRRLEKFK